MRFVPFSLFQFALKLRGEGVRESVAFSEVLKVAPSEGEAVQAILYAYAV